jgi:hypothetical protein
MTGTRSPVARTVAIAVLTAVLLCLPAARALGSVATELKSVADSSEGVRVAAKVRREIVAGSGRAELAQLLAAHPRNFTALQKGLARLYLRISAPRYRRLRAALAYNRMGPSEIPELKSFLGLAAESAAVRTMARKGEWLQRHPAALQSDLAVYATLADDPSVPPLAARLATILSGPAGARFVRGMSPLRIALLLVPGQEAMTPPVGGPGQASAVRSTVAQTCEAKAEQLAKRALNGYMAFGEFLFEGVDWAFQHVYGLALRFGPDPDDLVKTGLHVANHPTHAPEIVRDDATDWLLLAEFKALTIDTATRIRNWLHSKGWYVPTGEVQDRPAALAQRSAAQRSDAAIEGGSCHPAEPPATAAPETATREGAAGGTEPSPGKSGGTGALHWTGTMRYEAKASPLHEFYFEIFPSDSEVEYSGEAEAVWNVDARTPERGINPYEGVLLEPGEDMDFPLTYTGSWHVHLQYHWYCYEGSRTLTQELQASGSGGPAPTKGSYVEEVGIEIARPGWPGELRFANTPLGTETYSGEGCIAAESLNGVSWFGGLYNANFWQPRLGPDECVSEEWIELPLPIFNSGPGRITGKKAGYCGSFEWDLTVVCPANEAPTEEFTCPEPADAPRRASRPPGA